MAEFILAYHGGKKPESPEAGAKHMEDWRAWVEGLGDTMVNPGTPLGKSKTVSEEGVADDGGANPLSGFSVVKADSIDAAVEIAKGCPFLMMGTIEVAEMMQMPGA
ncbi:MAG: YciI family protein [Hyphomicrobiaceae bacterium]